MKGTRRNRQSVEAEDLQVALVAAENADHAAGTNIIFRKRPIRHMDGRLGDAVHVNKLRCLIAVPIEPRSQALHFQCFAAENDITESQFPLANRLFSLN